MFVRPHNEIVGNKYFQSGQMQIILLGTLFFVSLVLTGGLFTTQPTAIAPKTGFNLNNTPVPSPADTERQNLQLKTLGFITPSPTPIIGPSCFHFYTDDCSPRNCCASCMDNSSGTAGNYYIGPITGSSNAKFWCDAKPVIYLYPPEPTTVTVRLQVPGQILVSDPLYPKEGWQNITAYPNGTILYKGKEYKELFYEASITPISPPKNGVVVSKSQIAATLAEIANRLGFNNIESAALVDFWTNKLTMINKPYMLISYFEKSAKQKIDKVIIQPPPDTFIEYILYFKPIDNPISATALQFPPFPERKGFTAVEWGGIIDK